MATDAHGRQRPSRPTWPTITIRTRLTLTFTALVAIAGLFTVGIVTVFMRTIPVYVLPDTVATRTPEQAGATSSSAATVTADVAQPTGLTLRTTTDILDTTLVVSLLAVLLVVAVAALSAWIIAGRMLRPLKTINAAAQQAGAGTLDHRIGMVGPRDELRDLADTFDSMLDRLDRSFATTQRFAANASHELRTPLATTQTMLEVALSDPDIGADDLRAVAERVLETNRRGIAIVAALLELAEHDQRDVEFQDLDLVPLIESALDDERSTIEASGIAVTIERPASAPVRGDARLLRHAHRAIRPRHGPDRRHKRPRLRARSRHRRQHRPPAPRHAHASTPGRRRPSSNHRTTATGPSPAAASVRHNPGRDPKSRPLVRRVAT